MIQPGQPLPGATLYKFFGVEKDDYVLDPNAFFIQHLTESEMIVTFGLSDTFAPTCSARHTSGYLVNYDILRAKGVDEIWYVSVNNAFMMSAWARMQDTNDKIRILGDGNAEFTSKLSLDQNLSKRGMDVHSQRYMTIVKGSMVVALQVETPGQFSASSAESILAVF